MGNNNHIYCFRANYELSAEFNPQTIPDWLSVETNWQGYRISTIPWIADVARLLGHLQFEDTPEDWQRYLESLGLTNITRVSCDDLFEDKLFS